MLTDSDMQFFGNIPGMSPGVMRTNTNNNPNFGNQFISIQRTFTGPHGETIIQRFDNRGGNNNMDMMNNMMMNPLMMNNNSNNRRFIPFSNFGFGGMSSMGGIEEIFQQMLQRLGNHEHPTDQQILNELPETQIDDVTKLDTEKKNCVICLEDFKNGDKATVLPCIHLFHTNCIQSWLKTQDCCPICKFKLTGENLNSQPQ